MKTEFKNIAHLYMNCELKVHAALFQANGHSKSRVRRHNGAILSPSILADISEGTFQWGDFTPILRPLSSMTDDEAEELGCEYQEGLYNKDTISSDCIIGGHHHILEISRLAEIINHLRNNFYDIDGLIESGQAIDATTLETNPYKK